MKDVFGEETVFDDTPIKLKNWTKEEYESGIIKLKENDYFPIEPEVLSLGGEL